MGSEGAVSSTRHVQNLPAFEAEVPETLPVEIYRTMTDGSRGRAPSWMLNQRELPESLMSATATAGPGGLSGTAATGGDDFVGGGSSADISVQDDSKRTRALSMELFRRKGKHHPPPASSRDDMPPPGFLRSARIPRFVEAVGLTGRMKTFVVIEIFEGHQIIGNWKCNDLVQYVNEIASGYQRHPKSKKEEMRLFALLREAERRESEDIPAEFSSLAPVLSPTERRVMAEAVAATAGGASRTDPTATIVHHHHYYSRQGGARGRSGKPGGRATNFGGGVGQEATQSSQVSQLTYRDLRQVFTEGSPVPSIEVRRHCMVICLPPLSCILMADRVFILVVEDLEMDGLISSLQSVQLRHMGRLDAITERLAEDLVPKLIKTRFTSTESDVGTPPEMPLFPLEFESFELLVSATFEQLDADINHLEQRYQHIITNPKNSSPTSRGGEELHLLKSHTRVYQDRVALFDRAFNNIMSDPEEMFRMELTRLKESDQLVTAARLRHKRTSVLIQPSQETHQTQQLQPQDHAPRALDPVHHHGCPDPDLEILLEFFDQELEMFRQRVQRLSEKVESTERLARYHLALSRNRLLRWDVGSGMLAVAIGLGTLLSGIFGMNMESTLENSTLGFYSVAIIISVFTIVAFCAVLVLIKMVKL